MISTKDQERKALETIRKIIADLGEDSYLAIAFEGCLEDAADNIAYDAAFSMAQRFESTKVKLEAAQAAAEIHRVAREKTEVEAKAMEERCQKAEAELKQLKMQIMPTTAGLDVQCASLRMEVTELKAKLYDYMVAEQQTA